MNTCYITKLQQQKQKQLSYLDILDILNGNTSTLSKQKTTQYITYNNKTIDYAKTQLTNNGIHNTIKHLYEAIQPIKQQNINTLYTTFKIPKRTGGFRTINAPNTQLKHLQTLLSDIITRTVQTHNAAHAYIKNRSTLTAVQVHQKNKSNFFLKIDIHDFFPSCTPDFIKKQLKQIYPLIGLENDKLFDIIDSIAIKDNGLPQGAPSSPALTNSIMVPVDFAIEHILKKRDQNFVYTRYADDILISNKTAFNYKSIVSAINAYLLNNTPFKIKHEKTRYGSIKGSNWNLGLMLNKEYNITIGHRKKDKFKALTWHIVNNLNSLQLKEVQQFLGIYSYYHHIQPETTDKILATACSKIGNNMTTKTLLQTLQNYNRF